MKTATRGLPCAALLALAACSGGDGQVETAAQRGKKIYDNVCTTCHAGNPAEDGTIGPAIAGSSEELIRAKVIHGDYPPGYTPKRASKNMAKLPHLKDYIGDLAAYLQDSQATGG